MVLFFANEASFVLIYGPIGAIVLGLIVLLLLNLTTAPYGRYENKAFGFVVPARIAWVLQETPSICATVWFYFGASSHHTLTNTILLAIFTSHYVYRSWIYPFMLNSKNGFPLGPFLGAVSWCVYNGYMMGRYFGEFGPVYSNDYITTPAFVIGASIWAFGLMVNVHSDYTLATLRKPGETGYKIPFGGAYNFVTGANYFGEIVEWIGFAVASGMALPAVSFAIFTMCNIGPRAFHHHAWYKKTFGEKYPKHRKALIPYIW